MIISSSYMVFTPLGTGPRALCVDAFIQLPEFSKPPEEVVSPDVVK